MVSGLQGKTICLITPGNVGSNPRLVKEANALVQAGAQVHVIAADITRVAHVRERDRAEIAAASWICTQAGEWAMGGRLARGLLRRLAGMAWLRGCRRLACARWAFDPLIPALARLGRNVRADLYIAHNLAALPAAWDAARAHGAKLGFDAEDFHRGEYAAVPGHDLREALTEALENAYLPRCDYLTAASMPIAQAYAQACGIEMPEVVLNVFPLEEAPVAPAVRGSSGRRPSIYWFSQTIGPGRGLETAVEAIAASATRPQLFLRGSLAEGYLAELTALAARFGLHDVIQVLPPELPERMVRLAAEHDLGLASEMATPRNRDLCLTNKVFTYVLAGVPVLLSSTQAQRAVAGDLEGAAFLYDDGDPATLARHIDTLLAPGGALREARAAAWKLGQERFHWAREREVFLRVVARTLGPDDSRAARGAKLRVLCVAPRFAPVNAADSHRLRMLLPHFAAQGIDAEVLTVDPADVPGPHDEWLAQRLPAAVPIHRVRVAAPRGWGSNGLAQRAFMPMLRKGQELLATGRFALVFFSTTEFALHALGPLWRRQAGVPFCMDYQDPWVSDYPAGTRPPGGRLKFALASTVHRFTEPRVVRRCSGFLAVSRAYLEALDRRYGPAVCAQPRLVCGFPAAPDDVVEPRGRDADGSPPGSPQLWRYIGRGGEDLRKAATAFMRAWSLAIRAGLLDARSVRLEIDGTSYASDPRDKTFEPLAQAAGLSAQVQERPERLAYRATLERLHASDALVVFGSDDPGYTASKIFPYLLAGKPLLAIFHRDSSVVDLIERAGGATCVTFDASTSIDELAQQVFEAWFAQGSPPAAVALDVAAFEPWTAARQAAQVASWLRECTAYAARSRR